MFELSSLAAPMRLGDVDLSPVTAADYEALRAAANDEAIWRWYSFRADGPHFDTQFWPRYLGEHKPPKECHFVVRQEGVVVGSTCYLAANERHKRLEIGGTWYAAGSRRGAVNPSCKYLLMRRAFETGFERVELKTDSRNAPSRGAIEKLGAAYEGCLRRHMILHDGSWRDTVYYSVLAEEWPAAKARLEARLAAFAPGAGGEAL